MLVRISTRHRTVHIPKGRKPRFSNITMRPCTIPVAITEANVKEAPVVAEYSPRGSERECANFPFRAWNGKLYRPDVDVSDGRPCDVASLLAAAADPVHPWFGVGTDDMDARTTSSDMPIEDETAVTLLDSDLESRAACLHRWAAERLIVDGMVYRISSEPTLSFEIYGQNRRLKWHVCGSSVSEHEVEFRLDQATYAMDWLSDELGIKVTRTPPIRVLMPEFLARPVEATSLLAAATRLGQQLDRKWRAQFPRDAGYSPAIAARADVPSLTTVVELRKAVEDYAGIMGCRWECRKDVVEEPDPQITEAFVEKVESVLSAHGSLLEATGEEALVRRCRASIRRWRDAKLRDDADLGAVLAV